MKPPKCRACGVEEWRHRCAPVSSPQVPRAIKGNGQPPKDVANKVVDTAPRAKGAVVDKRTRDRHRKTKERREYLKEAQRRSRAARRVSGAAA